LSTRETTNNDCFDFNCSTVERYENNKGKGNTGTTRNDSKEKENYGKIGCHDGITGNPQVTAEKIFDPTSSRFQSPRIFNSTQPLRFFCYEYPDDSVRSHRAQIIRAFHVLDSSTDLVTMEMAFLSLLCLFHVESPEQFVSLASNKIRKTNKNIDVESFQLPAADEETEQYLWKLIIEASIAIPYLLKRTLKEFLIEEEPQGPGMSPINADIATHSIVEIIGIDHLQDISRLTETDLLTSVLNKDGDSILSQSTAKHLLKYFNIIGEKSKSRSRQVRDLIINGKWLGKPSGSLDRHSEGDEDEDAILDEDNYDEFDDDKSNQSCEA